MAKGFITRKGSPLSVSTHGITNGSNASLNPIVLNTGLVGAKKKAILSIFLVGANAGTPTITVTFYGSNDGTNFTQIGSPVALQKTGGTTATTHRIDEFNASGYTYFRASGAIPLTGNSFGYGLTLVLV